MSSAPPDRPTGPPAVRRSVGDRCQVPGANSTALREVHGTYPLTVLSSGDLRRWAFRAEAALKDCRRRLDALNVFPVPDGDTGTNLFMTVHAALESLVRGYLTVAPAGGVVAGTQALAQHMLFCAQGNSGVILSQLLRGLADALEAPVQTPADGAGPAAGVDPVVNGALAAKMLHGAACAARRAVSEPVEGTILTVADAAADAARAAAGAGADLAGVVDAAFRGADEALARTPEQLPLLARAGVVDAGGAGLVVILRALHEVVMGRAADVDGDAGGRADRTQWWLEGAATPVGEREPAVVDGGAYEVMYLLEGCLDDDAERLRARLLRLGDSVMVVGDQRLRTVHVHVDDAGAAVEAAVGLARMSGVRVSWLGGAAPPPDAGACECPVTGSGGRAASGHPTPGRAASEGPAGASTPKRSGPLGPQVPGMPARPAPGTTARTTGAVACAAGHGLAAAFGRAGAHCVDSRPGHRATTGDILEAVIATGCPDVVVQPNDEDARLAAQAAARLASDRGVRVHVLATSSPIEGLAAMAVLDPADDLAGNAARMSDAAGTVRCGRLAVATRTAVTEQGPCRAGDVLGFVGDTVVALGTDPVELALRLVERLAWDDAELVTLVAGRQDPDLLKRVAARLAQDRPDLEVTCLLGGQPVDVLLVGVE